MRKEFNNNHTDEVVAHQDLRKESLEGQLRERVKLLEEENKTLKQSNSDLKHFAFTASHDLKEPLRTIGGFATLLDKRYGSKLDDEGREYLDFIVSGVDRMSKLILNLLTYSQISNNTLSFTNVNVNSIVASILKDINLVIHERNVKINIAKLPSGLRGIETKITMLFSNLITNAIKFNESDIPIIDIDCVEVDDFYTFSVKDNGIGIPKKYQDRIFLLFNRLHNTDAYEGTGIGLSLCKKIVSQHGGDIHLESVEGEGTCFYFSIAKDKHLTL